MKIWYDNETNRVCLDADGSEAVQDTMKLLVDIARIGDEADKKLCHAIGPGLTELASRLTFTPRKGRSGQKASDKPGEAAKK